jgi:hypothetical protein
MPVNPYPSKFVIPELGVGTEEYLEHVIMLLRQRAAHVINLTDLKSRIVRILETEEWKFTSLNNTLTAV